MSELQKIEQAGDAYGAVIEFLEWISGRPYFAIGEWVEFTDKSGEPLRERRFVPTSRSSLALVYEYFGIEPVALEAERRELLGSFRAAGVLAGGHDPEPTPDPTPETLDLMEALKASLAAEQKRRG